MNADAYFKSIGNAITREEQRKRSNRERAENALALWEIRSTSALANGRIVERGNGIASNLRGTYRHLPDSIGCISLTDDLEWCLSKL